jgi:hypothetical protein
MNLTLEVTRPGAGPLSVDVELESITLEEFADAVEVAGPERLARLSRGEWDDLAARALLWAKLKKTVDLDFEELDIDFGDLAPFLVTRDPTLEASIPMEQKR